MPKRAPIDASASFTDGAAVEEAAALDDAAAGPSSERPHAAQRS